MLGTHVLLASCAAVALWGLAARAASGPRRLLHLMDLSMIALIGVMFYLSRNDMPGHIFDEGCIAPAMTAAKNMLWGLYLVSTAITNC